MDAVITAFVSGKGGTGKSTTAVFVGGALAELGKKVLVIELGQNLRSVDIIAGVSAQTVFDLADVLCNRCEPEKAMVDCTAYDGLKVLCAPFAFGEVTKPALRGLCAYCSETFDCILLDAPPGMGEGFDMATDVCHRAVLVLTPDPVALRDGRLLVDNLDVERIHPRLVLNRVELSRAMAKGVLRDLDEAMDTVGLPLLGVVPDSTLVATCANGGGPLPKQSREKAMYNAIARRLLGEEVPLVFG